MARKKSTTKIKRRRAVSAKSETQTRRKLFRWGESYTSLLLGLVVVIIGALFIGSLIKVRHIEQTSSISTIPLPSQTELKKSPTEFQRSKAYTVSAGESLWSISEKFYQSGYNWVAIARANNLADPGTIHAGNILILPSVTTTPEQTVTQIPTEQVPSAIKGNEYTVNKGDFLWDIAVRAYGDGYKWVDIARANNLQNPDLIFSGNTLKIPR